jgi:hypothetical protein
MSSPAEPKLTFRWPGEGPISFLLPGYLGLSALVHGAMFYIFQVTYPPAASIMPPPVQVTVLDRKLPQNAALFRWIDAEDPAATARTTEISPPSLFDVSYKPSYAEAHTLPQSPPPSVPVFHFPPAKTALDLVEEAASKPKPFEKIAAAKTAVHFSDSLPPRKAVLPQIAFTTKARAELQPTKFLAGVSDTGEVRYAFLQASSGDADIDQEAEANVSGIQFQSSSAGTLNWGFVTYEWGAEAYAQPASASVEKRRAP